MGAILTTIGEEWLMKTDVSGTATLDIGLYNDSTDAISDANDLADISTEPGGGSYARQSAAITVENISGDWGFDNDSQESFDTSDSTQTVDSYFIVANFQSSEASDTAATDHLVVTGALSQSRDLSQIDTLNIDAGGAGLTVN